MSTLNIMCVICSESYKTSDVVFSTFCGHLFHKQCLDRWLHTSPTCPQCRQQCNAMRVHRIFLNFGEPTELDDSNDIYMHYPEWRIPTSSVRNGVLVYDPPVNPLQSGIDRHGNKICVARCPIRGDIVPANYIPNKGRAYASWGCKAHKIPHNEIEYLVDDGSYSWLPASDGEVPEHAIVVGVAYGAIVGGEKLYCGRGQYHGDTYPGKVHPSHKCLYMPYHTEEVNASEYEVLVRLPKQPTSSQTEAVPQV